MKDVVRKGKCHFQPCHKCNFEMTTPNPNIVIINNRIILPYIICIIISLFCGDDGKIIISISLDKISFSIFCMHYGDKEEAIKIAVLSVVISELKTEKGQERDRSQKDRKRIANGQEKDRKRIKKILPFEESFILPFSIRLLSICYPFFYPFAIHPFPILSRFLATDVFCSQIR